MKCVEQALAESFHQHRAVKVKLFDEYQDTELTGIVVLIHTFRREIKLSIGEGEWEWIKIDGVVSVK
ncbi:YolD-like family protein [Paenibacillus sp. ISL-20]|uniref:YolD-like family protein n=1 Tax=Paenibacillus sp. ISL-20 TaxID=2819163 RepID=UPI001BE5C5A3|nr:YolD-like family protein [Paenibacillus sp. ISL-20]MBT2761885.1 YolD-like family protein [Paenibacillus sp. ISL-20]